jgi:transcription-repair coupling factor (superfamily II helicase)
MSLSGLLKSLLGDGSGHVGDPTLREAVADARTGAVTTLDITAPPALRPFAIAALADESVGANRPVLAITATGRETELLAASLRCLLPGEQVVEYPAWETLPHERLSPRSDTVGRRLSVLRRLVHPDETTPPIKVIVAPVRSVLQPQVAGLANLKPVRLAIGDTIELDDLAYRLAAAAYTRVDLVERRGEFAVRGGIVDVFPPTEEHPIRIDFWGDEVEDIRYFTVADQRSGEAAERGLWAPPCRELLLTDEVRSRAADLAERHPELGEMLEKIAAGVAVEGMESLTPVLVDEMELLVDLLADGTHIVVCDPERIRTRAHDLVATSEEFLGASWAAAAGGGTAPIDLGAASYKNLAEVRHRAIKHGLPWWSISSFGLDGDAAKAEPDVEADLNAELYAVDLGEEIVTTGAVTSREVDARPAEAYRGDTARLTADLKGWLATGGRAAVVTGGHGTAERIVEVLREAELPVRLDETIVEAPEPGVVHVTTGVLDNGFVVSNVLVVLTEDDITGRRVTSKSASSMPSRRRNTVDPLQLRPGDYLVHDQHGVGRYIEMTRRTVQGAAREYLVVEYAPSKRGQPADRLYVPTDQLDQVTKYVGGDAPSLDRIGGADWAKRKGRARKAVKEIAAELIKLYAARRSAPGYAFGPDSPWQRELEDAFPFVETPDQLSTIDEVKSDMQETVPMDRVIAGDVGYGKTEIAVRAAFKAVQDGKQVGVLVPTTLLVSQHYDTFTERYAQFPVTVRALSRFQSDAEAAEVLRGLKAGNVDVVIGTHRLLTGDVQFKDLGLLIVDEEQRFGVEHKEKLKHLRANVDVLTMSATPIPRTLEMSITGIRDMSVITTPPEERHPVLTYVGGYDEKQVTAAVRRELMRDGQVFFVHNRVDTIEKTAAHLRELVPEARVETAHGQMAEHRLEQVINAFWKREVDVLVCTTIVETGLDISNANTLIVDRAERLGLSQLHQLRGRVGRGRERAYAYFFYPRETPLTEEAHERLATIAQHSDLGAGMQVAMKDLEIRGAGNLLGGEQSGHIADVGFDLYVRLVGEAVANYRGDQADEVPDVKVELPVDAHIPHDYVGSERLRLEAYRRLSEAMDDAAVDEVRAELLDRYGTLPSAAENLLEVARFRAYARKAGLTEVTVQGNYVRYARVMLVDWQRARLSRLYPKSLVKDAVGTMLVPRPATSPVGGQPLRGVELLTWAGKVIDDILLHTP